MALRDYAKYGASTERKRLIARWEKGVNSLPRSAMATVREGSKGALVVVVDVQVGVMKDAWDATRVIGKVARTVCRVSCRAASSSASG